MPKQDVSSPDVLIDVESSNIKRVGFSEINSRIGRLFVEYSGAPDTFYIYTVPVSVWSDLLEVIEKKESLGEFLSNAVKPHFNFTKVEQ